MASKRRTLLCIDDHEESLAGWCLYLQNAGYNVQTARTPQEGLELFAVRTSASRSKTRTPSPSTRKPDPRGD